MTIRDRFTNRIRAVPAEIADAALRQYLVEIADAVNALPPLSVFSFDSPNSNVTAVPGTVGVNLAASSAATPLWVKGSGFGNSGWLSLRTA